MQRTSIIAEIFGYLVCLLAVVIFFVSVASIVNSAFGVASPMAGPRLIVRRIGSGPGHAGNALFWAGRANGGQMFGKGPVTIGRGALPGPPGFNVAAMRAHVTSDARFQSIRRLVLAIVMLVLSILVFRRAFDWINPKQGAS